MTYHKSIQPKLVDGKKERTLYEQWDTIERMGSAQSCAQARAAEIEDDTSQQVERSEPG